jgi:hypothetical protein
MKDSFLARIAHLGVETETRDILMQIYRCGSQRERIDDKNLRQTAMWQRIADEYFNNDQWKVVMNDHIQDDRVSLSFIDPNLTPTTKWSASDVRKQFKYIITSYALLYDRFHRSGEHEAGGPNDGEQIDGDDVFYEDFANKPPFDDSKRRLFLYVHLLWKRTPLLFCARTLPEELQLEVGVNYRRESANGSMSSFQPFTPPRRLPSAALLRSENTDISDQSSFDTSSVRYRHRGSCAADSGDQQSQSTHTRQISSSSNSRLSAENFTHSASHTSPSVRTMSDIADTISSGPSTSRSSGSGSRSVSYVSHSVLSASEDGDDDHQNAQSRSPPQHYSQERHASQRVILPKLTKHEIKALTCQAAKDASAESYFKSETAKVCVNVHPFV